MRETAAAGGGGGGAGGGGFGKVLPQQDAPGLVLGGHWVDLNQLLDSCRNALEAAGAPGAALRGPTDEVVTELTESSSSSSSSRESRTTAVALADSQGFEILSDPGLLSHWLSKFLGRHGAEQLALAPVQLAADAIRARAFQDAVDFVQQARSRTQQQRQQQQRSNTGSRLGKQQRRSRENWVGDELAEGYELLVPVQRSRAGAWRRKEVVEKRFSSGASVRADVAAGRGQQRPGISKALRAVAGASST